MRFSQHLSKGFPMLAVLQRVSEARVIVDGETIGEIGRGLLALVCAERGDTPSGAGKLLANRQRETI